MNKKPICITGKNTIVFMIPITVYNDKWRCTPCGATINN